MNNLREALRAQAENVREWFSENALDQNCGSPSPAEVITPPLSERFKTVVREMAEKVEMWFSENAPTQFGGRRGPKYDITVESEICETDFAKLFTLKKTNEKYTKNLL